MNSERQPPAERGAFDYFLTVPTRWMDNDVYGHVNNAVYYSYFDTVINRYLIEEGGLDFRNGSIVGIAVETMCRFHQAFSYPEVVEAGLGVGRLGNSSVRYEVGLFGPREEKARADGHFVHVFVDRASMRPVPIPDRVRLALGKLAK
jgi:acyl-CoA thioester hydrolase